MSVEDRLRAGLAADADLVNAAVETDLDLVMTRAAHRRRRRWAMGAAGVAAAASVATAAVTLDRDRGAQPDPVDDPPRSGVAALAGEYAVDVPGSAEADRLGLAGRWIVTIDDNGLIEFTPPTGQQGGVSGASMRVDEELAETNALQGLPGCQAGTGTGNYRWRLDQDSLTFEPVGEDCRARTILFGELTWRRLR